MVGENFEIYFSEMAENARLGSKDMQLNLKSQGAQDFGINIFFQDTFRNIKFSSYVSVKFLSWI